MVEGCSRLVGRQEPSGYVCDKRLERGVRWVVKTNGTAKAKSAYCNTDAMMHEVWCASGEAEARTYACSRWSPC